VHYSSLAVYTFVASKDDGDVPVKGELHVKSAVKLKAGY